MSGFACAAATRNLQTNVAFGLGLFDVCPSGDERGRPEGAGGQTLNKPRRRKPRSATARFEWGTAYGDLMPVTVDEIGVGWDPGPPTWRKSAPACVGRATHAHARKMELAKLASIGNSPLLALETQKPT